MAVLILHLKTLDVTSLILQTQFLLMLCRPQSARTIFKQTELRLPWCTAIQMSVK